MDALQLTYRKTILVLNSSYEPINETSWRRAVILVLKNKARVVSQRVIRLVNYVRLPLGRIMAGKPTPKRIKHRDNFMCQYCGTSGGSKNVLTIDHIIPKSRGGKDEWQNLVCACVDCNNTKDNRTPEEWGVPLMKRPTSPNIRFSSRTLNKVPEWMQYCYD